MLRIPRRMPRSGQRGTALIEFALVLPLLVVITFLVVDFGRAFFVKNLVEQSAREGARRLAVGASASEAIEITKDVASASGLDRGTVSVVADTVWTGGHVRVQVTAPFTWLYPGVINLLGMTGPASTLTGTCVMRREY